VCFDPLPVIDAVAVLSRGRDDVRLYFMGLRHPNPGVPQMEMEARAVDLASSLGLTDKSVFFNEGWVPHADRGAYYLEADVGVSAHFDDLETRYAFRTRLLDCFWAGLPVLTTTGDALAALVESRALGRVLPVGDVAAWVEAIDGILDDADGRQSNEDRLALVRKELAWPRVVEPLRRLVSNANAAPSSGLTPGMTGRYVHARLENALLQHGAAEAAAVALRRLTGRTRPLEERVRPPLT
jgi:glycosyltransferase involved in cell wall biosynthesis